MSNTLTPTTLKSLNQLLSESQSSFLGTLDHPESDPIGFLEYASSKAQFKIFALTNENGEQVGYISNLEKDDPRVAMIGPMFISEKYRGQGLGKLQVQLFIQWAKENGYTQIQTRTWGNNKGSRAIFEGLGFQIKEIIEKDRVDGDSTIKMN